MKRQKREAGRKIRRERERQEDKIERRWSEAVCVTEQVRCRLNLCLVWKTLITFQGSTDPGENKQSSAEPFK